MAASAGPESESTPSSQLSPPHILQPIPRINVDGVEGSTIPGGIHLVRYGGGSEYRVAEPILSAQVLGSDISTHPSWGRLVESLKSVSIDSLVVKHGFRSEEMFPSGRVPEAKDLTWDSHYHLVVSRMPPTSGGGEEDDGSQSQSPFASLMLHGFLFHEFQASQRKAHQKFPLLALLHTTNVRPMPENGAPQWLPTDGSFGWADQHVHKDEPVDFGDGFVFSEVFFGSDMARFAVEDPSVPAALWVAAVDVERSAAFLACVVVLPNSVAAGTTQLDESIRTASAVGDVAHLLAGEYGTSSSLVNCLLAMVPTDDRRREKAEEIEGGRADTART